MFFFPLCCSNNTHWQPEKKASHRADVVIETSVLLSDLKQAKVKFVFHFNECRLDCEHLNDSVLEFPIDSLVSAQVTARNPFHVAEVSAIALELEKEICSLFELPQRRQSHKRLSEEYEYALNLLFKNCFEICVLCRTAEECAQFKTLLEELRRTEKRTTLRDSCIALCAGNETRQGLISALLCDHEAQFAVSYPKFMDSGR